MVSTYTFGPPLLLFPPNLTTPPSRCLALENEIENRTPNSYGSVCLPTYTGHTHWFLSIHKKAREKFIMKSQNLRFYGTEGEAMAVTGLHTYSL